MMENNTTKKNVAIGFISGNGGLKNTICEMVSLVPTADNIDVPVDPRINIETIVMDDLDPKFVNVEVIRAGVISKTNHRRYNNQIVNEINDLICGVQGFYGHPDPSKEGFEFREPQCIFVGSIIDHMPDGLDRCIAKAYLFKTSSLREWIPKSIAAGNPMTVSINAVGDIMRNNYEDIIDVVHISELLSVDWANPGTEGVATSRAISVVREMQDKGGNNSMGNELNTQDIIKGITVAELKAYNPDRVTDIIKGITVAELQAHNSTVYEQIIRDNQIKEIALTVDGKEDKIKIQELQSVIDGLESTISTLKGDIQAAKIQEMKTKLLSDIPEQYRDKIGKRITGNTEDEIKKSIDAEVAYIKEMGGNWDNVPVGRQQVHNTTELSDAIAELFGVKKKEENK